MPNKYFPEEAITENDVFFVCSMVERVARKLHCRNREVVNAMGSDGLYHELSCAAASHCENPEKIAAQWIADYSLRPGSFDVLKVNPLLVAAPPTPTQMGGVYQRLVRDTRKDGESEQHGILRVYNDPLCERVDNYNASAYYEPSYYLAQAFEKGDF